MRSKKTRAVVDKVVKITGGTGVIRYRCDDGAEGDVPVIAEGWGDGYPSYWPPAVGDVIEIIENPVVIMKARPR